MRPGDSRELLSLSVWELTFFFKLKFRKIPLGEDVLPPLNELVDFSELFGLRPSPNGIGLGGICIERSKWVPLGWELGTSSMDFSFTWWSPYKKYMSKFRPYLIITLTKTKKWLHHFLTEREIQHYQFDFTSLILFWSLDNRSISLLSRLDSLKDTKFAVIQICKLDLRLIINNLSPYTNFEIIVSYVNSDWKRKKALQ